MKQLKAFQKSGKWGYRDRETDEILIPAKYEDISPSLEDLIPGPESKFAPDMSFCNPVVRVKRNGKWGIRTVNDKKITPFIFNDVKRNFGLDFSTIAKLGNSWGVISKDGKLNVSFVYDDVELRNGTYCIKKNNKWGYVGSEEFAPQYDDVSPHTTFKVLMLNNKKGLANYEGQIIVPIIYEDIYTFPYALNTAGVKQGGKWQIISLHNQIPITATAYEDLSGLTDSKTIAVKQNGKWSLITLEGLSISDLQFDEIICHDTGFLLCRIGSKWGALDCKGVIILDFEYDNIDIDRIFDEKFNGITKILPPGTVEVRIEYDFKFTFKREGVNGEMIYSPFPYIILKIKGKAEIIDTAGKTIIPFIYDEIGIKQHGIERYDTLPACLNGKWGFINLQNETVIPFIYDRANYFRSDDGLALVSLNNRCGLMNFQGETVLPIIYDSIIRNFENGVASVQTGDKFIKIDRGGKVVKYKDYKPCKRTIKKPFEKIPVRLTIENFPYLQHYFDEHPDEYEHFIRYAEAGRDMGRKAVMHHLIELFLKYYDRNEEKASIPYQMLITVMDEYEEEEKAYRINASLVNRMRHFYPDYPLIPDDMWKRTKIWDMVLQWTFPTLSMDMIKKYRKDEKKCAALCYGLWVRVGFDDGFFYRRWSQEETKLAVDLSLDDSGFWQRADCWGRPVIKFKPAPNKYHHAITLSVEDNPQILTKYPQYEISEDEIYKIKQFVKLNKEKILEICKER
ncbi:MAG: WG repeat-containing protein [Tannerella sp.]|jgi:hypothetical protein|nr:WG repeat-containing protein [Tannerella sp.]